MSSFRKHTEETKAALLRIQKENGNECCADCSEQHPKYACMIKGLFLCLHCGGLHRNFGTEVSRIKSIDTDVWTGEMLRLDSLQCYQTRVLKSSCAENGHDNHVNFLLFPPVKVNAVHKMTEKNRAAILELMKTANNTCADCGAPNPEWASASMGLFICITCSGIHRNLGAPVSVVKSLRLDTWTDEKLKFMEEHGNNKGSAKWAKNVPVFYRRPKPTDPHVLKEQWIRAKYERKEFVDGAPEPSYLNGSMRGYLRKKGKEDNSWNLRLFVLSANENSLCYFIKDQDEKPKCSFKVSEINVTFAQERTNKDNSLQITYVTKGLTRNYFVYSDSGKEIVDWYMAIRSAKLKILGQNGPGDDSERLNRQLTRDFTMEGFLDKRGPKGEPWQKRWFSLDGRRLLYLEKPLDPHAKGELIIGSHTEGFTIQEGHKSGKHQDEEYCFTLTVPGREYLFKANTENERNMWMDCISKVVAQPMTDEDKTEMKETRAGLKKHKSKSLTRTLRRSSFLNDEDSP